MFSRLATPRWAKSQLSLALELLGTCALSALALIALLVVGQLTQLKGLWSGLSAEARWEVLAQGGLIVLEPALPLVALLASGLTFGRRRAEGALIARAALGERPLTWLLMAAGLGSALGGLAAWLAQAPVPAAVERVGLRLQAGLLPALAAQGLELEGLSARQDGAGALWVVIHGPPATWLRAGRAELSSQTLELKDVYVFGPELRVRAKTLSWALGEVSLSRKLKMFGPPNAQPSAALGDDAHSRFTFHRRLALPAMAPLWALLGALLGASLGSALALGVGAGSVGLAYWLLRAGELLARDELLVPWAAAWVPALILGLSLVGLMPRLGRHLGA